MSKYTGPLFDLDDSTTPSSITIQKFQMFENRKESLK